MRLRVVLLRVLALALIVGTAGAWWLAHQMRPVAPGGPMVTVRIPPGSGARGVARTLRSRGLIRNEAVFLWLAARRGNASSLRAGTYRLSPAMSLSQILDRVAAGDRGAEDITVTIPEGFTVRQIAETLEACGVIREAGDLLKVSRQAASRLHAPFPLPATGLEGYLFPETYRFRRGTPAQSAAQEMLDTFVRSFYQSHRDRLANSPHSLHEIVTIASLIEREARAPQDRSRIAGVIENRLRRGMRLDIDATVLYALGRHKNRVLYRDLEVDSPYNTYRRKGLPPGPIASPGLASLRAALEPERHGFLYYVARPDGSHQFTRTLAEHNAAVARMRRGGRG